MPASLFGELDHSGSVVSNSSGMMGQFEDQRALQLALELSMLGLSDSPFSQLTNGHHGHGGGGNCNGSTGSDHSGFGSALSSATNNSMDSNVSSIFSSHLNHHQSNVNVEDLRSLFPKKSQNMTECVPVPSSEHVAEIVGRQGCKIKALRAKTNTYIKTPVRGEEPVFVVTGRKEDVAQAKREILSAAEHFSQIRASRKGNGAAVGGSGISGGTTPGSIIAPTPVPGQITIQVRVPYRVVGLVVGPKGATIKRIQQQTHTYIVTPSRDKDPVFEVTGLPDNVQIAKREIEAHIAIRTGALPLDNHGISLDDLSTSQIELLASLYAQKGANGFNLENFGSLGFGLLNSLSTTILGGSSNSAGTNSVGSSSSGGGSLTSLSSLNGFNGVGNHQTNGISNNNTNNNSIFGQMTDLSSFSILDNGLMSSSRSEDSYLFGGSGPNSIGGSQTKLSDLFAATAANNGGGGGGIVSNNNNNSGVIGSGCGGGQNNNGPTTNTNVSVGSSLWGSFDHDEGLGESPTLENGSTMWPELGSSTMRSSQSPPGLTLTIGSSATEKSE